MKLIILSSVLIATFIIAVMVVIFISSTTADRKKVQYCKKGGGIKSQVELNLSTAESETCSQDDGGFQCYSRYNRDNQLTFTGCAKYPCVDDNDEEMRNACKDTSTGRVCCCDSEWCIGSGSTETNTETDIGSGANEANTTETDIGTGATETNTLLT